MNNIDSLNNLVAQFTKLPGVGQKTAQRYAYSIINMSKEDAKTFSDAINEVKEKVHFCSVCGNYTDDDVCDICKTRDSSIICVVKDPKDIDAFEKIKDYKGVYHVLHGTLSPLSGIGPNDIKIKELLARLGNVKDEWEFNQ